MKSLLLMAVVLGGWVLPCAVRAQGSATDQAEVMAEAVPGPVVAAAVQAVGDLGQAVVQGRYQVALDRMNPKWKQRYAMRVGGMEALEGMLKQVATEMVRNGVTMLACKPQGAPQAFGVLPKPDAGGTRLVNSHWLVLVPTVTLFRVQQPDGGRVQIESTGFQVAVSERERGEWTFIDGAGLTINDLRSLFPTLPNDLQLPPVEKRQTQ